MIKVKTTHTPGPWYVGITEESVLADDQKIIHSTLQDSCDPSKPGYMKLQEMKANTRLIAAAPQMYRILSAILQHLRLNENVSRSALILGGEDEYLGKAIADVIANAEGRR